ncbi:MAG: hypothetical protein EB059_07910 [Alphaproteobacteria bacterium]|nr:hypothetical protein [Alphaproteobacteria bacterium]
MATAKKTKSKPQDFYALFFACVEKRGWFALTLPEIARATKTPLPELLQRFPDKADILTAFGQSIDVQLAQNVNESAEPLKDKLFDMVMRRFDALAPYRKGIVRLMDDMQAHPVSAAMLMLETLCGFHRSMILMMEMAGISTAHPRAMLAAMGLKIVYLSVLRTWKQDESADLSATMAILDRGLDRLIKLLRFG